MNKWIERLARNIQRWIDEWRGKEPSTPDQPDTPAPPPSTPSGLTGQERGFVWKPISEHGTLVVLLPEPFTGKTNRRIALERNGSVIAESNRAHDSVPQPNGNREHYRFGRKGGDYAGPLHVRVQADGSTWRWSIPSPGSRYDNLRATRNAAPAPSDPAPEPPPPVSGDVFRYEPSGNQIKVTIPRSMGAWKFHAFGRRRHATLYGPVNHAAHVYTIPMSGDALRNAAIQAGESDGSVLIFVNTNTVATPPHKNAGWRIMDPRRAVTGDGSRLKPGEDR